MADYKRQVSYMYLYEEGKKRNNIGYARVETKNGQCKYTIHITALGLNERQLKVYTFRRRHSEIEGVLLGTLLVKNNTGDFKTITEADNIMNSSHGIDDMAGVVVLFSDRKFFAAEWDSKPITMSMVTNINRKEERKPAKEEKTAAGPVAEERREVKAAGPVTEERKEIKAASPVAEERKEKKEPSPVTEEQKEMKVANLAEVLFEYAKTPKEEAYTPTSKEEVKDDKSLKDLLTPNINIVLEKDTDSGNGKKETVLENLLQTEEQAVVFPEAPVLDSDAEAEKDAAKEAVEQPLENIEEAIISPPEDEAENRKEAFNHQKELQEENREAEFNQYQEQPDENREAEFNHYQEQLEENREAVLNNYQDGEEISEPAEETGGIEESKDEKGNTPQLSAKPIFDDHPLAKQIYHNFPKMYPFEDNEIAWCARIEPKDIGMLPMDLWGLGNNSFLLHGYYSYRHLIFARVNDKTGQNYILGVPGIYHNREKFMAKMFGFENFKCAKKKPQRTGEYGYWYIPVLLNR